MTVSFQFAGRKYQARLLPATKAGETDAIVFGLGLNPKLDRVHVVFRSSETVGTAERWWSALGKLSPLAKAAIKAVEAA